MITSIISYWYYSKRSYVSRINSIKTINGEIKFMQRLIKRAPADDLMDKLTNIFIVHASEIHAEQIQLFSRLQKEYENDLGIKGYASQMLWACILIASQEEILLFK